MLTGNVYCLRSSTLLNIGTFDDYFNLKNMSTVNMVLEEIVTVSEVHVHVEVYPV